MFEESNPVGGLIKEFGKWTFICETHILLGQNHAHSVSNCSRLQGRQTSPLQKMKGSPVVKPVSITDRCVDLLVLLSFPPTWLLWGLTALAVCSVGNDAAVGWLLPFKFWCTSCMFWPLYVDSESCPQIPGPGTCGSEQPVGGVSASFASNDPGFPCMFPGVYFLHVPDAWFHLSL